MKNGHDLCTWKHVSTHGKSSVKSFPSGAMLTDLVVLLDAGYGTSAGRGSNVVRGASEHRGSETAQAHSRYALWHDAQLCRGEYTSLPQANVRTDVEKFAREETRGSDMLEGRFWGV